MSAHPEAALQTQIKIWVRECVDCPHLFLAFDRSRNVGGRQHLWEAQRGILAGTPDTCLLVPGMRSMWCELKAGKNTPSPRQKEVRYAILDAGHLCGWVNSVNGYRALLACWDVPLRHDAETMAMHKDALLNSAMMVLKAVRKASAKKPRAAGDASRTRRGSAIYNRVVTG